MKKKLIGTALAAGMTASLGAAVPAVVAGPAEAAGCTWYVYETTKNTTYWEYAWGNQVNGGFWKHPMKGTRLRTNDPFNGHNRTQIKYQEWHGQWQRLSLTKRYPYINRGAVDFKYCY